ncbi:MAG: hypothetical protein D6785_16475, partial [Planctomycetota bacterium]
MSRPNNLGSILLWTGELYFSMKNLHALALAKGIQHAEIPFTILTPGGEMEGEFSKRGLPVEKAEFLNLSLLDFIQMGFLVNKYKDKKPSLVHLTHFSQYRRALKFAKKLDLPLVMTVYGPNEVHFASHSLPSNIKAIIAVSEEVRENLVNRHRVPKDLIHVVLPAPCLDKEMKVKAYEENQVPVIGTMVSYKEDLTYFLKGAQQILE